MSDRAGSTPVGHAVFVFADDASHRDVLTAYLDEGVRAGDRVAFYATPERATLAFDYLRAVGHDPGALYATGRFVVGSAEKVYLPDGRFDADERMSVYRFAVRRAAADGYRGFRVAAEVPPAFADDPLRAYWAGYELRAELFAAAVPFSALCCYDANAWDGEALRTIRAVHARSEGGPPPAFRVRGCPDGALAVEGEIDFRDADALKDAMLAAVPDVVDPAIDVSALAFADVAGVRAIAAVAREFRRTCGRVEIRYPSRTFRTVWDMLVEHGAAPAAEVTA